MVDAGRNIFLVGPMGAGKTTVGRRLARMAALDFVDSDHEIQARTGVDIAYIFEREGEAGFRDREAQIITEISTRNGIVLATGGGAILNPETRQQLAARGFVTYLHATVQQQLDRTAHSRHRPLLQGVDRRATLEGLLKQRDPLYREVADFVIDIHRRSAHWLALAILRQMAQADADLLSTPRAVRQ